MKIYNIYSDVKRESPSAISSQRSPITIARLLYVGMDLRTVEGDARRMGKSQRNRHQTVCASQGRRM